MGQNLKEENKKLRDQLNSYQDSQTLMNAFQKQNLLIYLMILFLPVLGIYFLLKKENTISKPATIVWCMFAILILIEQLKWLAAII